MEAAVAPAAPAAKTARRGDCHENAADFISRVPDAVLCTIISLLPTKDGGRTQVFSRRWRPLWSAAPLNLDVRTPYPGPGVPVRTSSVSPDVVPKVSQHPGPARRFCFHGLRPGDLHDQAESWFRSRALANLEVLEVGYKVHGEKDLQELILARISLPPSAFSSAPTLLVAKIGYCDLPREMVPSMGFDLLELLSLISVSISADVFRGLLSACRALKSLHLAEVRGARCLHVRSPTLRSICFRDTSGKVELVIEDAPHLVRLLMPFGGRDDCGTIRVICAPKLEVLGPLLPVVSKLLVSQGISSAGLANSVHTVKILSLRCSGYELDGVLNILRRFPCLEKLYVVFHKHKEMDKKIEPQYDRLHPIECLQTHLKTVVFETFLGHDKQLEFAKFFVLNAKVLNKIEFEGFYGAYNSVSLAYQHRLLRVEDRASRDAQFEFMNRHRNTVNHLRKHIHDLSVADPFEQP
ncbi:F-box/FBD/LRR-repeat protein At4g00160-like [Triticum urartu]|uniref:FBD domain-containing protein n=1 Tax=Triticum urartu TaxID=4572 RepID=A0A8R7R551_TRIUA|nr:F-box/FBD/LRR-repeat protein At4g00160-like [Triticum urartu]